MILSQGTGTHSLIQNQMASRYSNFPVSLYQDRSWDKCCCFFSQYECELSLYTLIHLQYHVCVRVYVCACVCVCFWQGSAELSSC